MPNSHDLTRYTLQSYNKRIPINLFSEDGKSEEFHTVLGHDRDTFIGKKELVSFLDSNPSITIYLTVWDPDFTFQEVDGGFVVWIESFYEFQTRIRKANWQRVEAFLKQKSNIHNSSYSDQQRNRFIIENIWEDNLQEITNNLSTELKNLMISTLRTDQDSSNTDLESLIEQMPRWWITSRVLKIILSKISESTKIQQIIESLSEEELKQMNINSLDIIRNRVLENLRVRLEWSYSETSWDDSWQRWIFENCWLIWGNYAVPIEKQKINITGIMPDYLFPTHDWFVDILEIKLPIDEVIKEDPSHPWSWIWTSESNKALWQVVNYLWEIDRLRREIEDEIKRVYYRDVSLIKPRVYILIWNDDKWFADEQDENIRKDKRNRKLAALRKLNWSLHWIEFITYAELLRRGKSFISDIN